MRGVALAAILATGFVAAGGAAQIYRGGADAVLLSVTVTDSAGHHVPGLKSEDFRIFEDGVLQEVTHFSSQPEPISLSLLLDTSNSMELDNRMAMAQLAASGFVSRLGPNDVAQITDFDTTTKVLSDFTNDKAVLEGAIRQARAGGATRLYDTIYTALSDLKRLRSQRTEGEPRRQAIVLLSDGEDTNSLVEDEDVIELSKRCEVIVYAIAVSTKEPQATQGWNQAKFVLQSLTRETGGRVFFVTDPQQLPAIYIQVSEEISNQYSVGYVSKNTKRDGLWRKISLQVVKGNATPRTRTGYYAPTVAK